VTARLRAAHAGDRDAIVDVFQSARAAALPHLPVLHLGAEDRDFFDGHIASGATTVAAEGERVLGFIVVGEGRVEHLYIEPGAQRTGLGSLLLCNAQALNPDGLDLWVFQRNRTAIAFYEAHGFTTVETGDGSNNEEREPDARMTSSSSPRTRTAQSKPWNFVDVWNGF
jgi:ribosomal protein S18 acetylase RimI-like enzyme